MRSTPLFLGGLTCASGLLGQPTYQPAPPEIRRVLEAPAPPQLSVSPTGRHALVGTLRRHPPIRELARPMLRLAGLRIDPDTFGPHQGVALTHLELLDLETGRSRTLELPRGGRVGWPQWSPDGRWFAMTVVTAKATELWVGSTESLVLRKVPKLRLNAVLGDPIVWLPEGQGLLVKAVPGSHGPFPRSSEAPTGPRIQEHDPSVGRGAPLRTYQDLLQTPQDEVRFEYLATSQLHRVDPRTLRVQPVGRPELFDTVEPSPDGNHLLVAIRHRPFSYVVPVEFFPVRWVLWDLQGREEGLVTDRPLVEGLPIGGVRTGPRSLAWHPLEPATLHWVEALDGGDPKAHVPHRDRWMMWSAPFREAPREVLRTEHRFQDVQWTESGDVWLRELDRARNRIRTWLHGRGEAPRLLWELSVNERYRHPGTPQTRLRSNGTRVLREVQGRVLLVGAGATPQGDRPFLDTFDPRTGASERRFRCDEGAYETVVATLEGGAYITRRESPTDPPNYVLKRPGRPDRPLTHYEDPVPELRRIQKRLVRYQRADGVELSFTLYLPPDHREGQRHPALLWAYPLEYTDADTAGQVRGSTQRFTLLGGSSHLFMVLKGYAVLDDATMPVVGDPETVNNTFLDQVVASARAAIDRAAELGVVDPQRVAVGGHSYGAFMTANLLAHSKLFRCGIARSGAYNRTLTPFGFQSERRTLWEAPEMYLKVSPFLEAHRFNAPILLIHGEADDNPGTFPLQSDRLFQALKGNDRPVRYVSLPHEAHSYRAQESIEHVLWEMVTWLDRHLKP